MEGTKEILKLDNISLTYQAKTGEINAVNNLSFSINDGEFLSIIGPSGCGKSTILSIISGLIKPTKGNLIFAKDISQKNDVGYMLQRDHLFPWRNVLKNVLLPLEIKKELTEENANYAKELLEKYGLKDFIYSYPTQLSGGMKQRVALIRTLVFKPKLLLLDEPFSALDSQTRLKTTDDVYKIIKAEKKTAILVTHDISEAISMSDKILILTDRPATLKKITVPSLTEKTPHERRENPKFGEIFEELWRELN